MAKICMKCFEIYRGNFIIYNGRYSFCPKIDCHGEVIEVDELEDLAIIILFLASSCDSFVRG